MTNWLAAILALAVPAPARDAATEIRALRAQSNAAIAAHDADALRGLFLPDYTVLPGSSGAPSDRAATIERLAAAFIDPTFVTYVRTPTRIVIGTSGKRAAETGTWVGIWRKPDGIMRVSGVYQAMWLPTPQGWRLKNESFVSLGCTGSALCGASD